MGLDRDPEQLVRPVVLVVRVLRHLAYQSLTAGDVPDAGGRRIRVMGEENLSTVVHDIYVYLHLTPNAVT